MVAFLEEDFRSTTSNCSRGIYCASNKCNPQWKLATQLGTQYAEVTWAPFMRQCLCQMRLWQTFLASSKIQCSHWIFGDARKVEGNCMAVREQNGFNAPSIRDPIAIPGRLIGTLLNLAVRRRRQQTKEQQFEDHWNAVNLKLDELKEACSIAATRMSYTTFTRSWRCFQESPRTASPNRSNVD
jgi:hypothetical protein